jgi:hypothetical protein
MELCSSGGSNVANNINCHQCDNAREDCVDHVVCRRCRSLVNSSFPGGGGDGMAREFLELATGPASPDGPGVGFAIIG